MRTDLHCCTGAGLFCEYLPVYGFAAHAAHLTPVLSVGLRAVDGSIPPAGDLTVEIEEIGYRWTVSAETINRAAAPVRPSIQNQVTEPLKRISSWQQARMCVSIDDRQATTIPVTLIRAWEWMYDAATRIVPAAFVLPHDELVMRTVDETWSQLRSTALAVDGVVGGEPEQAPRRILAALYDYLSETCDLRHERARVELDPATGATVQRVRPPHEIFDHSRRSAGGGTCLDLTLLLAGCLESLGLSPLVLFAAEGDEQPGHAFLGCWTSTARRFRPVLTDRAKLRDQLHRGELAVLEATGVCRGDRRLDFATAEAAAGRCLEREFAYALDIRACRPPLGRVRSIDLPHDAVVQRAFWMSQQLGDEKGSAYREALHLLYGVCAAGGAITSWLFEQAGCDAAAVAALIERSLPRKQRSGSPGKTRNWESCLNEARANARMACCSVVRECDLLWALLESPSTNVQRFLAAAGSDATMLAELLEARCPRSGNRTASHQVPGTDPEPPPGRRHESGAR